MTNGQVSTSVLRCLHLFDQLLAHNGLAKDSAQQRSIFTALRDEQTRFKVWSGNIGAHKTGRSSLEYRLRDASHIEKQVLKLLDDLAALVEDAVAIVAGEKIPWDQLEDDLDPLDNADGDGQEEGLSETELGQIATDLKDVVNCLLRLSVAIRNPAPHDRFTALAATDTSHYEAFDIQHVRSKFNTINDALAERLGKAISRRRQYFKYREHHHSKLSHGLDTDMQKDTESTVASSIPKDKKDLAANPLVGVLEGDAQSDAGISQTSFASSAADDGHHVPPLPKDAERGPFECPFCFMMIAVTNAISWKRHVFSDLQPYICLSENCPALQKEFSRRHEWIEHEIRNHWKTYFCPCGCDQTFASAAMCKSHLQKAHSNDVPKGQLDAMISLSARPLKPEDGIACPLCREVLSSLKAYQRHVGRHQEQLALFALPSLESGDEIEAANEEDGSEEGSISEAERGRDSSESASLDQRGLSEEQPSGSQIASSLHTASQPTDIPHSQLIRLINLSVPQGVDKFRLAIKQYPAMLDLQPELQAAIDRETSPFVRSQLRQVVSTIMVHNQILKARINRNAATPSGLASGAAILSTSGEPSNADIASSSNAESGHPETSQPQAVSPTEGIIATMVNTSGTAGTHDTAMTVEPDSLQEIGDYDTSTQSLRYTGPDELQEAELPPDSRGPPLSSYTTRDEHGSISRLEEEYYEDNVSRFEHNLDEIKLGRAREQEERRREYKIPAELLQAKRELDEIKLREEQKAVEQEAITNYGVDDKGIQTILREKKVKQGETASGHPLYTRMARRHVSINTLRAFDIDFEHDADPNYFIIKRWVPEDEQDMLWRHTKIIREERKVELKIDDKDRRRQSEIDSESD